MVHVPYDSVGVLEECCLSSALSTKLAVADAHAGLGFTSAAQMSGSMQGH